MKVLFASPTYGPVWPNVTVGQRVAIMHAARFAGVTWVGDISPDGVKLSTIDATRNRIVKEALQSEADGIFWCDADIELPPHAVTALVGTGHDFVTGIYHQKAPPYYPVIAHYNAEQGVSGNMNWYVEWPENSVMTIDACGFGVVYTSLRLLRAMSAPWFEFTQFSEDFSFCRKAAQAGFQLYVHTAVLCGHMGAAEKFTTDVFRKHWHGVADPARDSAA